MVAFANSEMSAIAIFVLAIIGPLYVGLASWLWYAIQRRLDAADDRQENRIDDLQEQISLQRDRVSSIEALITKGAPTWTRTQGGIFLSVSKEFVRLFGAPHGYTATDFIGKSLEQLPAFPEELVCTLRALDQEALRRGRAARSGVTIFPGVTGTILKYCSSGLTGEVIFIGYAVDDEPPPITNPVAQAPVELIPVERE
jgi:hypothetical protein